MYVIGPFPFPAHHGCPTCGRCPTCGSHGTWPWSAPKIDWTQTTTPTQSGQTITVSAAGTVGG